MRSAHRLLVVPVVLVSLLGACTSSGSSSTDTVEQPDFNPDVEGGDPSVSVQQTLEAQAACRSGSEVSGREPRVVTTLSPITSLVAAIANGTGVEIRGIMPEGVDSHRFTPSSTDAAAIADADIVFMNGLSLEASTLDVAKQEAEGAVVCELGTATTEPSFWLYDDTFPKDENIPNPHLWTNPAIVLSYLTYVRDALVIADPADGDKFDANYVALSGRITALDEAMSKAAKTVPVRNRKLLTYHQGYAYLAERYGFEVAGAIQTADFSDPEPTEVAKIVDLIKRENVKAVFGSEVFPSTVVEEIGRLAGVPHGAVLRDDALPGEPDSAEHSWWGMMRGNFVTIVETLGGDASALKALDYDFPTGG